MKTKQTKIDRSGNMLLPGAMALAATTAASHAATVQITLAGNKISSTSAGGNTLSADLTGDGTNDLTLFGPAFSSYGARGRFNYNTAAYASYIRGVGRFGVQARFNWYVGGVRQAWAIGNSPQSISYLNAVTFTDSRINGGSPTEGWLQVNAFNSSLMSHTVELARLIFNDDSTSRPAFTSIPGVQPEWGVSAVPEPSGFAATSLLLGAAGLIRRRARAA